MKETSGKWIREGNNIILLDNDFHKIGVLIINTIEGD